MIQMEPVEGSSNIKEAGHDPETNTLHVRFHSGKTYAYMNVGPAAHQAFMQSSSKGSHFHHHIKSCHECKPCE